MNPKIVGSAVIFIRSNWQGKWNDHFSVARNLRRVLRADASIEAHSNGIVIDTSQLGAIAAHLARPSAFQRALIGHQLLPPIN